ELLSILYSNSKLYLRAVFIYNRSIIFIIYYYIAKRATNCKFIIACFLSVQLGYILYKYLIYIQLFIEIL
ncbi:hypothetical protein EDB80DRAFT_546492, partial [Ilyonectria destructans]